MRLYYLMSILGLVSLIVLSGCRSAEEPKKSGDVNKGTATISASPNPVPAGSEKFGKTTVTWDTGDGSVGQVYVSVNAKEEKLFADNRPKGTQEAAWIGKGEYEFRLYAGKEHKTMLASVKVRRDK